MMGLKVREVTLESVLPVLLPLVSLLQPAMKRDREHISQECFLPLETNHANRMGADGTPKEYKG